MSGWVYFQKEIIPSVEKRIERKKFTLAARRTHHQDVDSGKQPFPEKDPWHAAWQITIKRNISESG